MGQVAPEVPHGAKPERSMNPVLPSKKRSDRRGREPRWEPPDGRLARIPDEDEQPPGPRPKSWTDLNGAGQPLRYLRIQKASLRDRYVNAPGLRPGPLQARAIALHGKHPFAFAAKRQVFPVHPVSSGDSPHLPGFDGNHVVHDSTGRRQRKCPVGCSSLRPLPCPYWGDGNPQLRNPICARLCARDAVRQGATEETRKT